jgi:hypothetical protein
MEQPAVAAASSSITSICQRAASRSRLGAGGGAALLTRYMDTNSKVEYIELDPEELEAVALESKRIIEIDEFVPKKDIDELYLRDPYYIVPDGEVGQQAFAVIREAIRQEGMVAIGKVVFTSRSRRWQY